MSFVQQLLSRYQIDTFDRSDGALGSAWTTENLSGGDSTKVPVVFSNGVRNASATTNNTNYQGLAIYLDPFIHDNIRIEAPCSNANNGLVGGLLIRATADRQNFVVATATSSSVVIQYRQSGTISSAKSTISGSFFTTSDTFVLEANENQYQVKRIRSGTETLVGGWNDSTGEYVRTSDKTRMGVFGNSDRNFFGTQNWSLWFTQLSGWNI